MKKCVGNIALHGKLLRYYVFGSCKSGYGIEIVEITQKRANYIVSSELDSALSLARKLRRGSVFPANLDEIVEDFEI